jgi:hypothetical protein
MHARLFAAVGNRKRFGRLAFRSPIFTDFTSQSMATPPGIARSRTPIRCVYIGQVHHRADPSGRNCCAPDSPYLLVDIVTNSRDNAYLACNLMFPNGTLCPSCQPTAYRTLRFLISNVPQSPCVKAVLLAGSKLTGCVATKSVTSENIA